MYPILLDWPDWGLFLPAWHVFFALAGISSYFLLEFLRSRFFHIQVDPKFCARAFIAIYLGGYFGARALSILVEQSYLSLGSQILAIFQLGPMTFYGGMIGGILAGLFVIRKADVVFEDAWDLLLPAGLFALFLGRIGCFLNGDDYGIPLPELENGTAPWWAVQFPGEEIHRYPVQLIESAYAALSTVVWFGWLKTKRPKPGVLGSTCLLSYSIFRFGIEFYRGDERGWIIDQNISTSQGISLAIFPAALFLLVLFQTRKSEGHREGQRS